MLGVSQDNVSNNNINGKYDTQNFGFSNSESNFDLTPFSTAAQSGLFENRNPDNGSDLQNNTSSFNQKSDNNDGSNAFSSSEQPLFRFLMGT